MIDITSANFDAEVLASNLPVVVDFWAEWCMPCRFMKPVLEKLSGELAGRAKFVKVNADDESLLVSKYKVNALPTLVYFKDGKVVQLTSGMSSEKQIREVIDSL
jgi:thioredoxin 1